MLAANLCFFTKKMNFGFPFINYFHFCCQILWIARVSFFHLGLLSSKVHDVIVVGMEKFTEFIDCCN